MANLAVWNTILSIHLSICPAINLNALKNLQFPMLKNMQHAALLRIPVTSRDVLRGALVLLIKSTSSNPETAYPHALISTTNRLAERLPCCIPSHSIPITSRHSLCFPDPAVKRTDVRKSKQESVPLPILQSSDTDKHRHRHRRAHNDNRTHSPPNPLVHTYGVCPPLPFPRE